MCSGSVTWSRLGVVFIREFLQPFKALGGGGGATGRPLRQGRMGMLGHRVQCIAPEARWMLLAVAVH